MLIEDWSFDRPEAGHIVGFSEIQISNMENRYDLFDVKSQGKGSTKSYRLSDLMKLVAIRDLITLGIPTRKAIAAIDPFSIYGTMLHDRGRQALPQPGIFVLTRTPEGLRAYFDPRSRDEDRITIDTWSIFDRILPAMLAVMRKSAARIEDLEKRLQHSLAQIEELRADRHRG